MDNLRSTIELLFSRQCAESVIASHLGSPQERMDNKVDSGWFYEAFKNEYRHYTKDEIEAVHRILILHWINPHGIEEHIPDANSVFHVLLHFSDEVLLEEKEVPVCEYQHLLRWSDLSGKLGEDLFTTSYLASRDLSAQRDRHYFSWRPVIATNNYHLQEIFRKGIAELHFHLKGSSLNFDLNWLSLMNNIAKRHKEFHLLVSSLKPDVAYRFETKQTSLYHLCIKAGTIRLWLFRMLHGEELTERVPLYNALLKSDGEPDAIMGISDLQRDIARAKFQYGKEFGKDVVDYAIPRHLTEKDIAEDGCMANCVLYGERWLMYRMFRGIYSANSEIQSFSTLFYAYILIKERFRVELTQLNKQIGFANFADYEMRKDCFILKESIYDTLISNLAINSTRVNQNVKYIEARITPKPTVGKLQSFVKKIDREITDVRFMRIQTPPHCLLCPRTSFPCFSKEQASMKKTIHYYVLHFIKKRARIEEKANLYTQGIKARNWGLRAEIKQQTLALNKLRKSSNKVKNRIVGIDAANSEIGFRPEIFAQAYRYLKTYSCGTPHEYLFDTLFTPLGFTFHVGEDFLDLADGLRAIDECITFLNFRHGDRIGHALALGTSTEDYYALKNKTLVLPQQDFLDNVVWLLAKSKLLNLWVTPALAYQFEVWFIEYFSKIYGECIDEPITYSGYYQSMLLRGDDPSLYRLGKEGIDVNSNFVSFWHKCGLNDLNPEVRNARNSKIARDLYYRYHFDANVKKKGKISGEYRISADYISLIAAIQKKMRFELANKHIGIETNPTSNYKIGIYKKYIDHPMKQFYNLGLTHDHEELKGCPQISLSLNTDDQGVFSTYLENEYALMAIALEKELDTSGAQIYNPRQIYQWLDNIRAMGFEQRFVKTDSDI